MKSMKKEICSFRKSLKCACMAGFTFLILACGKSDKSGGQLTGKVTDTQGKPIAGAEIIADNTVIYNSNVLGNSNNDGNFSLKLFGNFTWMAHAQISKTYNNKKYTFRLHPDNAEAFTSGGAVRNFSWKLRGPSYEGTNMFYGSMIQLQNVIGDYTLAEEVDFTLTPVGTLVDGSTGQTITMRGGEPRTDAYYKLMDIPLGRYKLTAKHEGRVLQLMNYITNQTGTELTLDFEPAINVPGTVCNNCAIIEYH